PAPKTSSLVDDEQAHRSSANENGIEMRLMKEAPPGRSYLVRGAQGNRVSSTDSRAISRASRGRQRRLDPTDCWGRWLRTTWCSTGKLGQRNAIGFDANPKLES